ncbi:MAG: NUDIX domain-containing protein [Candidatus Poseidoniia archaeon]|jgi:8-oxo-dGTP pyrophosphatase MutT (NUDIX family)|nr:NUDIX domain-containing protein [Candidatus Poseidoniia archaeon]MDP7136411.1 NUDIX domain-containing protein [Candidatus Poseidoniia archaeon]MDP7243522.1 NUDIX domain-containing protein [Candidatus Poseidoniia archaeon]MDP7535367.1 NUDIX domain-containing protein [Candidatus Poseidoniia archaeon]MDP7590750.1 NUDIX domain-containing protein [Candidatus Poseidoniia archaeon]|tara:strand:- start:629 stop:1039 length:411 start_codon:yes stop_codon:yes gene_type:complete
MSHPTKRVATSILLHGDRILILKRSAEVGSFQHHWSGVSGFVEPGEEPLETSQREVEEETGIPRASLELLARAPSRRVEKPDKIFEVHSFLYRCAIDRVRLDWENDEFAWVAPESLRDYRTVPWLPEMVTELLAKL